MIIFMLLLLLLYYTDAQGPPPKKRSRLEDADPPNHYTDGVSTAGPSSASGLDTKLSERKPKEFCMWPWLVLDKGHNLNNYLHPLHRPQH